MSAIRRMMMRKAGSLYTMLESVCNGAEAPRCAYIKTGLYPQDQYWRFVGSWKRIGEMKAAYTRVVRQYIDESTNCYRLLRYASTDNAVYINAWSRPTNGTVIYNVNLLNTWYTYDLRYGAVTINGETTYLNTVQGNIAQLEVELCSDNFPMRIGEFKAYHNDDLVAHLVPCKRNSDGAIGMYDIVRNLFLTSVNEYKFTE